MEIECKAGEENLARSEFNTLGNKSCSSCECSICYNKIENQCIVLECKHPFHLNCIKSWILSSEPIKTTCPFCREEINNHKITYIINDWETMAKYAFENNDEETIVTLLRRDHGIDYFKERYNQAYLFYIIESKFNRLLEILLAKKMITMDDIENKSNDMGYSLLHAAAQFDNDVACSLLLDHGANIEIQDNNLDTPLFIATNFYSHKTLRLLLERGANPNAVNNLEKSPLFELPDFACAKTLLDYGANPNLLDKNRSSPLHIYAIYCNAELSKRSDVNISEDELIAVADLLLSKGADINARNIQGQTPLFIASMLKDKGSEKMCNFLVSRGADVNIPDNYGNKPQVCWKEKVGEKRQRQGEPGPGHSYSLRPRKTTTMTAIDRAFSFYFF